MRQFVGIDLGVEWTPDETTTCKFRRLLTQNQLGKKVVARVNEHRNASGILATVNGWDYLKTKTCHVRGREHHAIGSVSPDGLDFPGDKRL